MAGDPNMYMGRGDAAVKGDDRQRIADLSDPAQRAAIEATRQAAVQANAKQNLQAATTSQGQVAPPIDDQVADHIMQQLHMQDPLDYMKSIQARIADMESAAKDVEKSGTGNTGAQNAYMQVAQILRKRLAGLQVQHTGGATSQPSTQPAGGQQ